MENIPDSPEGIILESLLEGMNQYYSAELAQKINRGLKESWSKGQTTGGRTFFGNRRYKTKNIPRFLGIFSFLRYASGYTTISMSESGKVQHG